MADLSFTCFTRDIAESAMTKIIGEINLNTIKSILNNYCVLEDDYCKIFDNLLKKKSRLSYDINLSNYKKKRLLVDLNYFSEMINFSKISATDNKIPVSNFAVQTCRNHCKLVGENITRKSLSSTFKSNAKYKEYCEDYKKEVGSHLVSSDYESIERRFKRIQKAVRRQKKVQEIEIENSKITEEINCKVKKTYKEVLDEKMESWGRCYSETNNLLVKGTKLTDINPEDLNKSKNFLFLKLIIGKIEPTKKLDSELNENKTKGEEEKDRERRKGKEIEESEKNERTKKVRKGGRSANYHNSKGKQKNRSATLTPEEESNSKYSRIFTTKNTRKKYNQFLSTDPITNGNFFSPLLDLDNKGDNISVLETIPVVGKMKTMIARNQEIRKEKIRKKQAEEEEKNRLEQEKKEKLMKKSAELKEKKKEEGDPKLSCKNFFYYVMKNTKCEDLGKDIIDTIHSLSNFNMEDKNLTQKLQTVGIKASIDDPKNKEKYQMYRKIMTKFMRSGGFSNCQLN